MTEGLFSSPPNKNAQAYYPIAKIKLGSIDPRLSKALADTDYPAMLTTEKRIRTLLNNCKQEETTHPRHSEIMKQRNPYIFVVALHVTQH